ncbi:MAG: hypothetical protein ABSB59_07225 [Streptosporangiaceae bacterium]
MMLTGRMRTVAAGLAGAGCVLLAAGCGNSSSGLSSVGSTATATATAQSTGSSGAPLKLAHFPATKDGDLARTICQTWSSLRGEYYSRIKADTASQLSQWFTGPDWTTVHADAFQLEADTAYIQLGAAVTQAVAGSVASAKTGQAVDRACTAGK